MIFCDVIGFVYDMKCVFFQNRFQWKDCKLCYVGYNIVYFKFVFEVEMISYNVVFVGRLIGIFVF